MKLKQKEIIWVGLVIAFYILTGVMGIYDITKVITWPILAIPMSLLLIKTGQNELVGMIGVMLALIISFINTSSVNLAVISVFLLFILVPSFVMGTLYRKKVSIPQIIIGTTITIFLSTIIFMTFSKLLGVEYLEMYFASLDALQERVNNELNNQIVGELMPAANNMKEIMGAAILQTKRTYPAGLFVMSLMTSTLHLLLVQLVAYVRSWDRPTMREILNVGLSPVAAWVLVALWFLIIRMGKTDTIWLFTAQSMLVVLFMLFQIIGMISLIVMIGKIGAKRIFRVLLTAISVFWFIFNPTFLVIIGCLDSMFNFRKVKTLI